MDNLILWIADEDSQPYDMIIGFKEIKKYLDEYERKLKNNHGNKRDTDRGDS